MKRFGPDLPLHIAADVISADPRMKYAPEKVRVALALTAHNVDGGYWNTASDGRDGTGTVSGTDAIQFAKQHVTVDPDQVIAVEHGLSYGALGSSDSGRLIELKVKVPANCSLDRNKGKHLRIVLTWNSIPDRDVNRNTLSDLDLMFSSNGSSYNYFSMSDDSNFEVIDDPANTLTAGETYSMIVSVSQARIPANAVTDKFYRATGWTWVLDHAQFDPDVKGCVDQNDVDAVLQSVIGIAPANPAFDLNGDDKYNIADAKKAVSFCTNAHCTP